MNIKLLISGKSPLYKKKYYTIKPDKIICLGRNYKAHAQELGDNIPSEPILFIKTKNVLIGNNEPIIIPKILSKMNFPRVDYEGELAVIIGKDCKNVKRENAFDYILGYTCFNDVTARDMQQVDLKQSNPWFRSKSLDTFGPIGPIIVTTEIIKDPNNLKLETRLNGKIVQKANTSEMIFKVDFLIEYISSLMILKSGDIICTGTPSGIGMLKPNDTIEVEIENIGILRNYVVMEN